jgi:hypothetical protein
LTSFFDASNASSSVPVRNTNIVEIIAQNITSH